MNRTDSAMKIEEMCKFMKNRPNYKQRFRILIEKEEEALREKLRPK